MKPESEFPLWPNGAPAARGTAAVDVPTLTPFLPTQDATGAAMIVCPGGGYGNHAEHEGSHYARWFNEHGIAAFVLKYRLGRDGYRHPAMLHDAARAVRTVRARASEWNLDPMRIGIIGSSAGGHLVSTLLTHFDGSDRNVSDPIDRQSSRPDLAILCYPVVTMSDPFAHAGSRSNLLGDNPSPELLRKLSADLNIVANAPPCFIWHTGEDKSVPVENSLQLAGALRRAGVSFDLHIYERGGHGLGLGNRSNDTANFHPWTRDCAFWLKQRGFAK